MKEISQDLELKNFPDIYNENNTELLKKINELSDKIASLINENKGLRDEIRLLFNTSLSKLQTDIDKRMDDYEKKFVMIDEIENDSEY